MKSFCFLLLVCLLQPSVYAQSDQVASSDTLRTFTIREGQKYLNFPVSDSAPSVHARILLDGKMLDNLTIKLATGKPDYWVFFDASPYNGKTLTVEISKPEFNSRRPVQIVSNKENSVPDYRGMKLLFADSRFPGEDSLYKEKDRPQIHFTSRRGWLNDPNGLNYYHGQYHLFYQHNPYGWAWGNMHWGHAVSKDLLHWKELPDALYPMNSRDAAFSGSAVTDPQNTAGFRKNGVDPLIVFYTSTGRGECMKISYDDGRTFDDYGKNPILVHKGRDPKVFWYEAGKRWVMIVYDFSKTRKLSLGQEATINQHMIYTSPDLKNWTFQCGIEGFFECPEFFELPVEGEPGNKKWVMYDATGRYMVGEFDGKKFKVLQQLKKYDNGGKCFYASQTYNNTPDGRRIQIGWGRGMTNPGMPFNQPMLFPTVLKLKNSFDGLRLCPTPIEQIAELSKTNQLFENRILKDNEEVTATVNSEAVHIVAEFEKGDAGRFGLNVMGYDLFYEDLIGEFLNGGSGHYNATSYARPGKEEFRIEVIVDKNIMEVFVNDGELYYVIPFEGPKTNKISALAKGTGRDRKAVLKKMEVHELKSIWED